MLSEDSADGPRLRADAALMAAHWSYEQSIAPLILAAGMKGIEEKYDRFSNLKARVIDPAVKDLVAKTSLNVSWKGHKAGKTVDRLEFRFSEKSQLSLAL